MTVSVGKGRVVVAATAVGVAMAALAGGARAQSYYDDGYGSAYEDLSARVWFDRGDEPLVRHGERVRVYYRTNQDAFVAIFNIDTDGTVRLVYPRSPDENNYVRGGRDYRLLFPRSSYWFVDEQPGMGYYFVVASPEPLDFSRFDYSYYDRGWDLSFVGRSVYGDPYVAMDDYVAALIPEWEYVGYALDFSSYHVGDQRHEYPRFLCYDCHGFRAYSVWDPYYYNCSQFRVVVYNDPWYYPVNRYRAGRVVYVRPPEPRQPRFVFKERADGESGGVLVTSRPPAVDRPGIEGDGPRRRTTSGIGSGGTRGSSISPPGRPGGGSAGVPDGVGVPRRGGGTSGAAERPGSRGRPSDALPGRGGVGDPAPGRSTAGVRRPDPTGARPVLPPDPRTERPRPVLERRGPGDPRSGAGPTRSDPGARPGGAGSTTGPAARPPVRSAPPGARPGGRPGSGGAGGSPGVRPPGGGAAGAGTSGRARPTPTSGRPGGGSVSPPSARSSGSSGGTRPVVRAPARSGGGASRPAARPPASRSSGGVSARPPVRKPGGGSGPAARSSAGSSSSGSRTPARPPVRRGGGGA